jgi:hypothetical protein
MDPYMADFPDVIRWDAEALWLPNGLPIAYPDLRFDTQGVGNPTGEMVYTGPYGAARRIHGPKVVENVTQGLARVVVMDKILTVKHQTGLTPFMTTHDSLDYLVHEDQVQPFDALLEREFAIAPAWAPDLPLASEGGWGRTMLDAEHAVNN